MIFKLLQLSNGEAAMVDAEGYDDLLRFNWHLGGGGYIVGRLKGSPKGQKNIRLHRYIMKAEEGVEIDHANRYRGDNRRLNLRPCSKSQNLANRTLPKSKSGYRGVRKRPDCERWDCQIKVNGKTIHVGFFTSPEDAARAYNEAALKYYGEFATLNNL